MIQRFRCDEENPELWQDMLAQLTRYRECCDEVWFSNGIGVEPLAEHRKKSALMAAAAADLRKIGIAPGFQLQATIGHSDRLANESTHRAKTWGSYVGKNGEKCRFMNCPRQPEFLEYMRELCRIYAQWHPSSVWIDDDLRISNHMPASEYGGCHCDYCVELFSRREGKHYTRETLVEAYSKDAGLYQRYIDYGIESITGLTAVIAGAFHEISPETRIGMQHCGDPARIAIFRKIQEVTGMRAASRPGGGFYSDHAPREIFFKAQLLSRQLATQPGYEMLDQICPEIENCPRTFSCKTPQGLRLESLLYLALGMDSISYFITAPYLETPQWYGENLFAPLAEEAPAYREFARSNENTVNGGVRLAAVWNEKMVSEFPAYGIPYAGFDAHAQVSAVTAGFLKQCSDEEARKVLSGNIILDGEAAHYVVEKGWGDLLGNMQVEAFGTYALEHYTGDEVCTGLSSKMFSPLWTNRFRFTLPPEGDFRVAGIYKEVGSGNECGNATVLYTRPDGSRAAVLGFTGFDLQFISSSRVQMLYNIADWASGNTLPALPLEPVQCAVVPRLKQDGSLCSVTVMNCLIGKQKSFELRLRCLPETPGKVLWCVPGSAPVAAAFRREKDFVVVTMPEIAPWDIGFLKFVF